MNNTRSSLEIMFEKMSDSELIEIIEKKSKDYTEEANKIANSEINRRGGLNLLKKKIEEEINMSKNEELKIEKEHIEQEQKTPKKQVEDKNKEIKQSEKEPQEVYKFKVLLAYGNIFSGIGWLVVIIGICIILFSFIEGKDLLPMIGVGLIVIIFGFFLVASGQVVSCFVEIERNTRMTYMNLVKNKTNEM